MDWLMINSVLSFILVLILILAFRKTKQEDQKFPKRQFLISLVAGIGIFVLILSNLL
ncbi:hypothetical protein [Bacillus sp. REN3]|uniref:hypothetical protein n=1 Tax=Bacillus sp. REN3 TaxID=2802440 RepID=UPI001AEE866C|nr:hypothetical protein [Bacillus sp. REN3]